MPPVTLAELVALSTKCRNEGYAYLDELLEEQLQEFVEECARKMRSAATDGKRSALCYWNTARKIEDFRERVKTKGFGVLIGHEILNKTFKVFHKTAADRVVGNEKIKYKLIEGERLGRKNYTGVEFFWS